MIEVLFCVCVCVFVFIYLFIYFHLHYSYNFSDFLAFLSFIIIYILNIYVISKFYFSYSLFY